MKHCVTCGIKNSKGQHNRSIIERHHINYYPEATIPLCRRCHQIITRYERGSTETWDERAMDIITAYHKLNPTEYINYGGEVISVRLPAELAFAIRSRARAKNLTLSEYLTTCIQYIIKHSNHQVVGQAIPLYNPQKRYNAGEKVLVQKGKRLVEVTVPELDGNGHPIYD